jgi:hypothetical protein
MNGSPIADAFSTADWRRISRGELIEVVDRGLVIARGVVEDYTGDRQIVRLRVSYGGSRRSFHQKDGWQLRPVRRNA